MTRTHYFIFAVNLRIDATAITKKELEYTRMYIVQNKNKLSLI